LALVDEAQRDRIEAMALMGRRRAVGEDMAKVAAAARAYDLGADHAVAGVADAADVRLVVGLEEAGPAGARIELGGGPEQRQSAQPAHVGALALVVQEYAAERALGAVLQQHVALLGRQRGGQRLQLLRIGRGEVETAHRWLRGRGAQHAPAGPAGEPSADDPLTPPARDANTLLPRLAARSQSRRR